MEPSKFGVENLKKVVALGIEIGNVADKFGKAEGTANKISTLMALTDEVLAIPGVDFNKVKDEVGDLDDAEKAELLQFVKDKFDISNDKLEASIEGGLGIALKLEALVKEGIALVNSLKA